MKNLSDGNINLIIGTHTLFLENIKFKNLGLAIQKLCGNLQINFSWGEFTQEQNNVLSVRKIFFSFPNVIQALIKFFWEVKSKWPLQKQGKSAWHTGGGVFFFVLILFTWT